MAVDGFVESTGDGEGWKGENVAHRPITVNENSMVECCDISRRSSNV